MQSTEGRDRVNTNRWWEYYFELRCIHSPTPWKSRWEINEFPGFHKKFHTV